MENIKEMSLEELKALKKQVDKAIEKKSQRCETHDDGTKYWYSGRRLHRIGGPAEIDKDGKRSYYINGQLHRDNGPAVCYTHIADYEYYQHGVLHRVDGPAVLWTTANNDAQKEWWFNGLRHRVDGPAIIRPDGTEEYWFAGTQYEPAKKIVPQKKPEFASIDD